MSIARSCIHVLYTFATAMNGRWSWRSVGDWGHALLKALLGFQHSSWLHIDFGFYLYLSNLYPPPFVEIPPFGWRKPHFCRSKFPSCRSNSFSPQIPDLGPPSTVPGEVRWGGFEGPRGICFPRPTPDVGDWENEKMGPSDPYILIWGGSINGESPKMDGLSWKILLKWMI